MLSLSRLLQPLATPCLHLAPPTLTSCRLLATSPCLLRLRTPAWKARRAEESPEQPATTATSRTLSSNYREERIVVCDEGAILAFWHPEVGMGRAATELDNINFYSIIGIFVVNCGKTLFFCLK